MSRRSSPGGDGADDAPGDWDDDAEEDYDEYDEEYDEEYEDEDEEDESDEDGRLKRAPWHFKVILVGTVVYLGYRAYQGIAWVVHHV